MKKHHAYTISWIDSSSLRGWKSIDDPALTKISTITSIGWMVAQTDKVVSISTSISDCGNVCDALTIPRKAILKMTRLKNHVADETQR